MDIKLPVLKAHKKEKIINVLSLFDGISCGQVALDRAGIEVDNYFASEINPHSIKITKNNYPNTIQLGDIEYWREWHLPHIDLIIGGSPCQSISNMGDKSGLDGKSKLFYDFYNILSWYQPKYFLLENVQGNKKALATISDLMGVDGIKINSNKITAQNRPRVYWTNIPYQEIEGEGPYLEDILEEGVPEDSILTPGRERWIKSENGQNAIRKGYCAIDPIRANCLTRRSEGSWNSNYVTREGQLTKLTPVEYERLQTLPDDYTAGIPRGKRYEVLGDGWTVDVVAHILKGLTVAHGGSHNVHTAERKRN